MVPGTLAYPAIFHSEENGGFMIEFPDIPGAYTGINESDITRGVAMAEEVLKMVLADMLDHGESLPVPTAMDKILCEKGSFVRFVEIKISSPNS